VSLINQNKILLVMLYISLTTIFGILFCYLGMNIFK
jgi:fluoride ion exporter CrcB/FEX